MNNIEAETSILQFEFDEEVHTLTTIKDSEDIKFIRNEEYNDKPAVTLTGFEITIRQSDEEKITKAKEQTAPRLTNILSNVTGKAISYRPPKVRRIRNGKTYYAVYSTVKSGWLRPIDIDSIDISKLSSLLDTDSKLNLNLAHTHNGQRAFSNNDFPQGIREFYLIFGNTGRLEEMKYKNLRHAASHIKLSSEDAVRDLRGNFRIPIKRGDDIDLNDSKIKKFLERRQES
jgi:hypothetical protein